MINVLERKGVLTGKEVLDELEVIMAAKGMTFSVSAASLFYKELYD